MSRAARATLFGSLLVGLLLSGSSTALHSRLRTTTGLTRVVYDTPDLSGLELDRATARTVDLALLDRDPGLPRRLFSIRWSGLWYLPRQGDYELFLGADDRATLTIDGQLLLERSLELGMNTISTMVSLDAGFHSIVVEYEQDGGGIYLNLQWAPAGSAGTALDPYALFPTEPTTATLRLNSLANVVRRAARLLWIVILGVFAWLGGAWVVRAGRAQPGGWHGVRTRLAHRTREILPRLRWMSSTLAVGLPILVVCYAAALRLDALVAEFGPLDRPPWARSLQTVATERLPQLRPASFGWTRVADPYVGGDPITYIRFAKAMNSFYGASVREPVFPFVTKVFLWLLDQQNVAVSFASASFSILCVWATWLLGAYVFSRWVGLGAALALAIEREAILWGVDGWRDDAFTLFVVLFGYALVRCFRNLSYANAIFAGVVAGLACLTRITALSFLIPGFVALAVVNRAGPTRRRLHTVGLAVVIMAVMTAPFLVNCWRVYGDPLWSINAHTVFYQERAGMTPDPSQSAASYISTMLVERPGETLGTLAKGLTIYPFTNKWTGFEPWLPGLGRWLSWSALIGLALLLRSSQGRLLLMVMVMSLFPYAFTWNIVGGAEWRFTEHAYPFFLIAACWTPVYATRIVASADPSRR